MGNKVQEFRHEKHISMEKLAYACDVTRETIRTVERNETKPNVYLALRIADVLDKSVNEVFYLD